MQVWKKIQNLLWPKSKIDVCRDDIKKAYNREASTGKYSMLRILHSRLKQLYLNIHDYENAKLCQELEDLWRDKFHEQLKK